MPVALTHHDILRDVIASIRGNPGLTPEAAKLLELSAASAQGVPLADLMPLLEAAESELSKFLAFMRLCFDHRDLKAEFDRLPPISQSIDDATGKFEADARAFFDFCLDLYHRLPKAGQ